MDGTDKFSQSAILTMTPVDGLLEPADWPAISDYVSAGSIESVSVSRDFGSVEVNVNYANWRDGVTYEGSFRISCLHLRYINIGRREDHEPGASIILEAYLHTNSPLIDDLLGHRLDGVSGSLVEPSVGNSQHWYHLEIIGEIDVNILCGDLRFSAIFPRVTDP